METLRWVWDTARDAALVPVRKATSKSAIRAYLGTALFFLTTIALLSISSISFLIFYNFYIPKIGVEKIIHLQFGDGHPQGTAYLASALTSSQPYDILISLHLPRTPSNLATGNFMLDLSLLAPTDPTSSTPSSPADPLSTALSNQNTSTTILARARRPAILTYTSPLVSTASTLTNLPLLLFGWKREAETLDIPMLEGISFGRGRRTVPDAVRVVVESNERMQFYAVAVKIRARFQGLRWLLYNYRLLSFGVFTAAFFGTTFSAALVGYVVVAVWLEQDKSKSKSLPGPGGWEMNGKRQAGPKRETSESESAFKREERDASRGRSTTPQQLLDGVGSGVAVKREEDEEELGELGGLGQLNGLNGLGGLEGALTGVQPLGAEADDEDEELGGSSSAWRDSGIGTGREDRDREKAGGPRRRRSYGS